MTAAVMALPILGVTYATALLVWVEVMQSKYDRCIAAPWAATIASHDWEACAFYQSEAARYLSDFHPSLRHALPDHLWATWRRRYGTAIDRRPPTPEGQHD
jgi:hypothetical protein